MDTHIDPHAVGASTSIVAIILSALQSSTGHMIVALLVTAVVNYIVAYLKARTAKLNTQLCTNCQKELVNASTATPVSR